MMRGTNSWSADNEMSKQEVARLEDAQFVVSQLGAKLVQKYLQDLKSKGLITGFNWVSREDALSPFDFWLDSGNSKVLLCVKSSNNDFESPFQVSYNELLKMRESVNRYDMYRVYQISDNAAQVRIAQNLQTFATETLKILDQLPQWVRPDSISVVPSHLPFGEPFTIRLNPQKQ